MKNHFTLLFVLICLSQITAQSSVATFEEFNLAEGEFLNGSDGNGGFSSGDIFLPNDYNEAWDAWTGWAISATTDTQTPGFMNQYSSIVGGGQNGSGTYATSYVSGRSVLHVEENNRVEGLYVTNGTYPYLSMLEGDGFAKKFGGEDGTDPDFFLLTIKGYKDGNLLSDSVDFYLADYRFQDDAQDYIVDEWTWVNLEELGPVDSLQFTLSSSDVGIFGMNTPAYFCIDDVTTSLLSSASEPVQLFQVELFPNPATEKLMIRWDGAFPGDAIIYDNHGKKCLIQKLLPGQQEMIVGHLPAGMYVLQLHTEWGISSKKWIKK